MKCLTLENLKNSHGQFFSIFCYIYIGEKLSTIHLLTTQFAKFMSSSDIWSWTVIKWNVGGVITPMIASSDVLYFKMSWIRFETLSWFPFDFLARNSYQPEDEEDYEEEDGDGVGGGGDGRNSDNNNKRKRKHERRNRNNKSRKNSAYYNDEGDGGGGGGGGGFIRGGSSANGNYGRRSSLLLLLLSTATMGLGISFAEIWALLLWEQSSKKLFSFGLIIMEFVFRLKICFLCC